MTRAIIHVETDEPVLVLVIPLQPRKCGELPATARQVVETTAEPLPANVVRLRRTA